MRITKPQFHRRFFPLLTNEELNNVIVSIVREHHWSPEVIGNLHYEYGDYESLMYWYNDIVKVQDELKKEASKSKK